MHEERQRAERRSGAERRIAERRSATARGLMPAARDRRSLLRRLWYRRHVLYRRAAPNLPKGEDTATVTTP